MQSPSELQPKSKPAMFTPAYLSCPALAGAVPVEAGALLVLALELELKLEEDVVDALLILLGGAEEAVPGTHCE